MSARNPFSSSLEPHCGVLHPSSRPPSRLRASKLFATTQRDLKCRMRRREGGEANAAGGCTLQKCALTVVVAEVTFFQRQTNGQINGGGKEKPHSARRARGDYEGILSFKRLNKWQSLYLYAPLALCAVSSFLSFAAVSSV